MEQFKTKTEEFGQIRRKIFWNSVPAAIGMVVVCLILLYAIPAATVMDILFWTLPGYIIVAFGFFRGIQRQKIIFESYVLTVSDREIIREQHDTPTIHLPWSEIREIYKDKDGSMTVKGRSSRDVIVVPSQTDGLDRIEYLLSQIIPLKTGSRAAWKSLLSGLLAVAVIGLMISLCLASHKLIIALSGVLVSAVMIWSMVELKQNKSVDAETKKQLRLLIIVLLLVAAVTAYRLVG